MKYKYVAKFNRLNQFDASVLMFDVIRQYKNPIINIFCGYSITCTDKEKAIALAKELNAAEQCEE